MTEVSLASRASCSSGPSSLELLTTGRRSGDKKNGMEGGGSSKGKLNGRGGGGCGWGWSVNGEKGGNESVWSTEVWGSEGVEGGSDKS